MSEPILVTPGVIAKRFGIPVHRILYVLATRKHIRPKARAGTLRLYDEAAVASIGHELHFIELRGGKGGSDGH